MVQNKCYSFCEDIALLILRITLFVVLIIVVFKIDNGWTKAVAIAASVVIVMFKGLNFLEVSNVLRAAGPIDWNSRGEANSLSVTTPEKQKKEWVDVDDKKIIKTDFVESKDLPF